MSTDGKTSKEMGGVADTVSLLSDFRLAALRKTADIVAFPPSDEQREQVHSFSHIAAILSMALDFLRLAEETLVTQEARRGAGEAQLDARLAYERRLFDMAPTALVVTTLTGAIVEANRAAAALVGSEPSQLYRMPLEECLPGDDRTDFRTRLARAGSLERKTHWQFRVQRRRDVPVAVRAVAQVVPLAIPATGASGLFWSITPNDALHFVFDEKVDDERLRGGRSASRRTPSGSVSEGDYLSFI